MAIDRPARPLMVQGTTSNAGKSLITAGLCRIFKQDGLRVAPFKSQNMALNSFVTAGGLEMGRAQVVQAECAGKAPDARMNPILLKPTSDVGSQVILNGRPIGNMTAREYYTKKPELMRPVLEAYHSLAAENDVVVVEGAGSPAEINLREHDLVNMGLAERIGAPVLLVGDIDRGGVFAALAGTLLLLTESERERVKGVIVNKFRGDGSVLQPGLDMLEEIIRKPVVGVVPYLDVDIEDEDSLSDRLRGGRAGLVDICVVRLPHISNFSDFNPFQIIEGVSVRYAASARELGNPDLVILPGTKNTIGDLLWLRQNGLEAAVQKLAARGTPVFGVCGGYQMLGETLRDPLGLEQGGLECGGEVPGMGLLPGDTVFEPEKTQLQTAGTFGAVGGVFEGLSGLPFTGYEIHMGRTEGGGAPLVNLADARGDGAQRGNVCGCYIHGIFDDAAVASTIVRALAAQKGVDLDGAGAGGFAAHKERQYELLAQGLRSSLDMGRIYAILEETEHETGLCGA